MDQRKILDALRVTRQTFTGLKPFQPPDILNLRNKLRDMQFNSGEPNGVFFEAVDILVGAYTFHKRRYTQVLSEWEV